MSLNCIPGCVFATSAEMHLRNNPSHCVIHSSLDNKRAWTGEDIAFFVQAIEFATSHFDSLGRPLNLTGLLLPKHCPLPLHPKHGLVMQGAQSVIENPEVFQHLVVDFELVLRDLFFPNAMSFLGSEFNRTVRLSFGGGQDVDFSDAIFRAELEITNCSVRNLKLDRVQFYETATLESINAVVKLSLEHARFHKEMSCKASVGSVSLSNVDCLEYATLTITARGEETNTVQDASFKSFADFTGSSFEGSLAFDNTKVEMGAMFDRVRFGSLATFENCTLGGASFVGGADDAHNSFDDEVYFKNSRFQGAAVFTNRHFRSAADFTGCIFAIAPDFHGSDIHQGVTFPRESAFEDTRTEGAAASYRTLKLAMEKNRARREEAMFFALEQKSLRNTGGLSRLDWATSFAYEKLARYGQSYSRPVAALAICWLLFSAGYACWLSRGPLDSSAAIDGKSIAGAMLLSFEQIVNPMGIWRKNESDLSYLGVNVGALRVIATLESVLSLVFLALFILGLRWRFKRE